MASDLNEATLLRTCDRVMKSTKSTGDSVELAQGVRDLQAKLRLVEQERDDVQEALRLERIGRAGACQQIRDELGASGAPSDERNIDNIRELRTIAKYADAADATIAACRALPVHHGIMLPDVPDGGP